MPVRRKRSISMPPALDQAIEVAAAAEGVTYSGWLAGIARREFIIRAGLDAVAQFEQEHGPFTADERSEARDWAERAAGPSPREATPPAQSA